MILYRIDEEGRDFVRYNRGMNDESGTAFCEDCAADALESGVFTTGCEE